MTDDGYDVFLSCAGPDRPRVRRLYRALGRAGLRVFLDEQDIEPAEGINAAIEDALRSSIALVAFYSAAYTDRPACQLELTATFLAGQQEGDPAGRIIVVNPEPGVEHIQPARLADPKYVVLPADESRLDALAGLIRDRVRRLRGSIGQVRFTDRPRWFAGRVPGVVGFVGRYRDLWALHSVLEQVEHPLTSEPTSGPAATLIGLPGIGKTALLAAYGWQFGAAYPGGVYWTSLAGAGSADADLLLGRYADEVRAIADTLGLRPDGQSREQLFGRVADHLHSRGPSLWIVDDVPDGLDPAILHRMVIPAGVRVRTVFVAHTDRYAGVANPVVLGPMTVQDAESFLRRFRVPGEAELAAFHQVAERLGGHPIALRLASERLRDREGLLSYAGYLSGRAGLDSSAVAADLLRTAITELPPPARLVVQLAAICGPGSLPARLVALTLAGLPAAGIPPDPVGTVPDSAGGGWDLAGNGLAYLRDRLLATRTDLLWQVHSLVLDAAGGHRHLGEPVPAVQLARAAAAAVDRLANDPDVTPLELLSLLRIAGVLAGRTDLPARAIDALLTRLARHYERRGEPVFAASYRTRLADRHPNSAADQVAAAAALQAAGHFEAAADRASRVPPDSGPAAYRADLVRAQALDALGRFARADPIWTRLTAATPPPVPPAEHLAVRVAHLRSLRLRGQMLDVRRLAGQLTPAYLDAADPAVLDAMQAAELEVARVEVLTDGQRAARRRASRVIAHYRDRGLPQHAQALQAQDVLAEADLTLHLTELRPDPHAWERAVDELERLCEEYRRSYGPNNAHTLATTVQYAYALASQRRPDQARDELTAIFAHLVRQFGEQHPLYLRALFIVGLTYAQRDDYPQSRQVLETAYAGQLAVLGPLHAHTLRTEYELAVALKFTGEQQRSAQLIDEVFRLAPRGVGRMNDLYTQAAVAKVLLKHLPASVIRIVTRWGRPTSDHPR